MPELSLVRDIVVPAACVLLGGGGVGVFLTWRISVWQKKTKQLEIKADILRYSAGASMAAIRSAESCFSDASSLLGSDPFTRTVRAQATARAHHARWVTDSAQVQSLIDIYFPGSNLRDIWKAHFDAIEAAFTAFSIAPDLMALADEIREQPGVETGKVDQLVRAKRWHPDLVQKYIGEDALPANHWEAAMGGSAMDFEFAGAWVHIREASCRSTRPSPGTFGQPSCSSSSNRGGRPWCRLVSRGAQNRTDRAPGRCPNVAHDALETGNSRQNRPEHRRASIPVFIELHGILREPPETARKPLFG